MVRDSQKTFSRSAHEVRIVGERTDKALFDTISIVGTLILGLITSSGERLEFSVLTRPKELHFFIVFLHGVAEYGGYNQVVVCLAQFLFNAIYDVEAYFWAIPVVSIVCSLVALLLRSLLGWALFCYGERLEHFFGPHIVPFNKMFEHILDAIQAQQSLRSSSASFSQDAYPFGDFTTSYFLAFAAPMMFVLCILPFELWYVHARTRAAKLHAIAGHNTADPLRRIAARPMVPAHADRPLQVKR